MNDDMPEPDEMPEPTEMGSDRLVGRVVVDRYRIENVVSSGANTVITEAIDVTNDVPVTLKIVRPERAIHAAFRDDFQRQVEVAMALSHPNIARVLDWGEVELYGETTVFWVVEYLGGGSLRDLFDRGRLLEPSQALVVGLEACRALDAAHSSGVIHTELTPSKLVFGDDARLRIVDFAMAELLGAESWEEPATLATHVACYASPEQALRLEVDDKTDVYALSLCLIEAITGKVPFAGDSTVSTLSARVGKLMPVTADMGSLAAVLERAGRPEGEDRWTAAEFATALVQAAETLPRPEPIPIMASSLFGASMLQRQAERDAETVDAEPAAPLILLTDIADQSADDMSAGVVPAAPTEQLSATAVVEAAIATTPPTTVMDAVDPTMPGTIYDDERQSRPWGRYIGIGLLVVAGIVALGIVLFLLLRTKSYEVPDLVGVDQAVALNEVSGNDWVIETNRERSDEIPEVDHVVRTTPAAGEMLDEGATFVIYVSDGPELRTIPELAGMALADAQTALTDLRLVIVEATPEFSEDVPAGSIIRWQVKENPSLVAGAQVLPDTIIEVTVSLGPAPRPAPDLTNLTLDEATAAVGAVQLVTARGDDEFSDTIEVGRVVTQDPPPTTPVERGGTVTVRISKGPDLVAFPDLAGQLYPQAQETLAAAGYTVNSLLGTTEGTFVSASIDGTEVQAGATFPRGTGVDLIFL
ncbi:MAG TPA: PASTA domain-containing protein [Ilumatobacteraceae bacterium]|nr:PASTA domain-containing protein [Ilumatobacteraceae bacterium]